MACYEWPRGVLPPMTLPGGKVPAHLQLPRQTDDEPRASARRETRAGNEHSHATFLMLSSFKIPLYFSFLSRVVG